ncbi:hypothetical protein FA10DRAFT_304332 [Acaromyces ingoldii]|uniref:Uncharacterized protein n=1 Tax=Acaromyces ingoldii TaxID=215250 RepID=A0A316YHJ1_9BASI|nr:hypothetical protein FA10DRAFT_304332 [Acaromyces ingoldii]PWN87573.1 hypothetical protein FA10DRAFT_304332 [Acaromyces ingoldii]
MVDGSNWIWILIVLGPVGWRKLQSWRATKRAEAAAAAATSSSRPASRRPFFQLPRPLFLPSNLLLSAVVIGLVVYHLRVLVRTALGQDLQDGDVFLVSGTGTRASVAEVRSRVASMSWSELGWRSAWGEDGLEMLLRRLTSYEGRRLHLLVGTAPLLECAFCTTASDLALYSLAGRLVQYSAHLLLFGLLTLRCDSLEVVDEVFRTLGLLRSPSSASTPNGAPVRPHRAPWRGTATYVLVAMLLVECAILFDLFDLSFGYGAGGRSRWNHASWHANVHLARHIVLLLLSLSIYLRPTLPRPPALVEAAVLLGRLRTNLEETMTQVQTHRLSNEVVWSDAGLRQAAGRWWDHVEQPPSEEEQQLDGGAGVVDIGALQGRARETAAKVWAEVERNWARWGPKTVLLDRSQDQPVSQSQNTGSSGGGGSSSSGNADQQQQQPPSVGPLQDSRATNVGGPGARDSEEQQTGKPAVHSSGP